MKKIEEKQTNRLIATALNILLQLVIICLILLYFSELFVYYYVISFALGILFCISVINKKTNSGYKIAWIVLLLAIPIFGVALYLMLGGGITRTRIGKKMLKITEDIKDNFSDEEEVAFDDEYAKMQSEYIRRYSYSPPVKNTRCRYFTGGEAYFESLLGDLKTAEKTIYMEYFIIKESYMWSEITDILIEKASKGVDVKVIYDGVGSMDRISKAELKRLTKAGIKIKAFNIFVPIISSIQNNRDHRKICTIDSKIAYCGGVNIADEYINRESKFGHFKDSGIALYGEATYNFEVFFLTLWKYVSGEDVSINKQKYEQFDEGIYQPYTDSPIDAEYIGKNIYMNIISKAKKYVYISTPYFVVDDEMLSTITNAAKCGVDVRIILPHIPDKKTVNQVTKSYYTRLVEAGVKVYEYKRGFNHSKIVVADDMVATVGSVNFDYRSFYLSFECGVWMYKSEGVKGALTDFNTMLVDCIRIDKEACKTNIFVRIFRAILATVAPMF